MAEHGLSLSALDIDITHMLLNLYCALPRLSKVRGRSFLRDPA